MKKITFLMVLFFIAGTVSSQTTYQITWQIGVNGDDASLTIDVGDTVEWVWGENSIPHTVTSQAGSQESFNSGTLTGMGQTFSHTFTEAGINPYQCNVHPGSMFGTITVVATAEPCEDPSGISFSTISDTSAEVLWTENGDATEWEIEYGEAGFIPGNGTLINDNDGTLGETLNDLEPDTSYDVYVRAVCTDAESNWVGPESFTTEIAPCQAPSEIMISTDTEEAMVSWTENGDATEWEIEYGETGFTQGNGTLVVDNDGTLGETITDLNQNTDYDVYVRSVCTGNESNWVGPETFSLQNVGVDNQDFKQFYIYVNQQMLYLTASTPIQQVEVFNLLGKKVMHKNTHALTLSYGIDSMDTGIYLVKVTINHSSKVFKIIKR